MRGMLGNIYDLHDINKVEICGKKIVDVSEGWEITEIEYRPWVAESGSEVEKMVIVIEKK